MAKKKKGFGKKEEIPTRPTRDFILAFQKRIDKYGESSTKVYELVEAKLDESILEVLPRVFDRLITNKTSKERKNIARLFVVLGELLEDLHTGNRQLNQEVSILAYQLALKVFMRKAFFKEWAVIQNNLGNAYAVRIRGNKDDNLERAIIAYESALQVYTREGFFIQWAGMQNNLGGAYLHRIRGERADNLEKALMACESALQVYSRETFPIQWAAMQNNLGKAYLHRIRGERADNLEKALIAFELALQVRTYKGLTATQNNLGDAYLYRIRGERADNLEKAIPFYESALQVYTREAFPEHWATTQHNIANAYREQIRGERDNNLEQAISTYKLAAEVFTRDAYPYKWAINQSSLAEALTQRAELTENSQDLDTAIDLLESALEVSPVGSPDFIDSQYRLGNALSRRYEYGQNPEDIEKALQAYQTALDAISPEHYDREKMWQALPSTQSILGSRLVRDGAYQEGLQLLLNSINQLKDSSDRKAYANALFQTGRAHESLYDWDSARTYYRDALRLYEHLNNSLGVAQSREGLGSVFVSQGLLARGSQELLIARDGYNNLGKSDRAAKVTQRYQAAQNALEQLAEEIY
ncbi:MAG: tetratricopeptide repeat protein [Spirulina sp.]